MLFLFFLPAAFAFSNLVLRTKSQLLNRLRMPLRIANGKTGRKLKTKSMREVEDLDAVQLLGWKALKFPVDFGRFDLGEFRLRGVLSCALFRHWNSSPGQRTPVSCPPSLSLSLPAINASLTNPRSDAALPAAHVRKYIAPQSPEVEKNRELCSHMQLEQCRKSQPFSDKWTPQFQRNRPFARFALKQ